MRVLPLLVCLLATPCAAQAPPRQPTASDYIARRAHAAALSEDAAALWGVGLTVHFGAAAVAGIYTAFGLDRGLDCLLEACPTGTTPDFAYAWLAVSAVGLAIAIVGGGFSIASALAHADVQRIYGAVIPLEGGARASISIRF